MDSVEATADTSCFVYLIALHRANEVFGVVGQTRHSQETPGGGEGGGGGEETDGRGRARWAAGEETNKKNKTKKLLSTRVNVCVDEQTT